MVLRKRHRVGKPFVWSGSELHRALRAGALLWRALVLNAGFVLVSSAALAVSPTQITSQTCIGDCDNSRTVTVDEILTGVSITLGSLSLEQCPRFDCDGIGQVTVDCIIGAVEAALNGCDSGPTSVRHAPVPRPRRARPRRHGRRRLQRRAPQST